ncbi:uncharacterized protein LOC113334559 [Papaver somniferum]|uniref:uncharacterized protein LOC113334559 n=1 Tax=Papaver somniferum TaxID=3469 RepID=UPI000E6FBEF3|nr:uncharacterized protein LOC113334559 [Papaver somniferum]
MQALGHIGLRGPMPVRHSGSERSSNNIGESPAVVLKSLTPVYGDASAGSSFLDVGDVECADMLRLQSGNEVVVKGRTEWRPKPVKNFGVPGQSGTKLVGSISGKSTC